MSNTLNWQENDTNKERLRQVYNFINWLMFEMQDGTIPDMNMPLSIAFVKMAENGDIDEVTASEHADMFISWTDTGVYNIGDLRQYDNKLFKCLQAHTAQEGWAPDITPALWKECGIASNGIPEWSQPISANDAYMVNDEVMYEGTHYRSLMNNNVWSPVDYPQGWEIVQE